MKKILKISLMLLLHLINFSKITADSISTVIDAPGTYRFTFMGSFEPRDYSDSLIRVQSNDVVIDLQNFTFSQTGTVTGFNGIYIAPGLSNIYIKNGSIKDLSGYGIYISDACSEIMIERMVISSCNGGGIYCNGEVYGCAGLNITESSIATCTGLNNGPAYGLYVKNTSNVNLTHTYMTYNTSRVSPAYGAYFDGCDSCHFINAIFNYNCGTPLSVGAYLKNCKDCQFLYSATSFNYLADNLSTSSAIGIVFDGTESSGAAECVSVTNGGPVGNGIGYKIFGGYNNAFKECGAMGNSGGNTGTGFIIGTEENSTHINQSFSLSNKGGVGGYGILLDGCINCTVLENKLNNNSGALVGVAYMDTSTSNNNIIKHNLYYHNSTQADVD